MSDASVFVMSVHIAVRRRHLRARCASLRRSMQSARTSSSNSLLLLRMIFGSCKARTLLHKQLIQYVMQNLPGCLLHNDKLLFLTLRVAHGSYGCRQELYWFVLVENRVIYNKERQV
ncbi:hypothetical protein BD410DRAFT_788934 [Rickenella mellea]|uniref:Uncharacterized protein n=1 Tax=Rickenella mellea TaxID=50990 RepID=A0A4Y7Q3J5_9AGAM|nr:hypothetical protein BD410DRAFT_795843 [Rickenella mellea]TDL22207.1 hypothetical protein BD410DRAFT_788934 [Rickenella mellea]